MIKVLHVITGLGVGGGEMMLYRLLKQLDRNWYSSTVISLASGGALKEQILALGVPVHELGLTLSRPMPTAYFRLKRLMRQIDPDVVQGWMYHGNLAALAARRIPGLPPIFWGIHATLQGERPFGRVTSALMQLGARWSTIPAATIYVARTSLDQHVMSGYARVNAHVIPVGVDTEAFRPDPAAREGVRNELGVPEHTPLVGMFARYHPGKDHGTFLQAIATLCSRAKSDALPVFVLAGTGITADHPALGPLIQRLGIGPQVRLLGERQDIPRLMAALDVYCSTSLSEACPTVLLEALASGVLCVATDAGDSRAIIGKFGHCVAFRSPSIVGATIAELLSRPAVERQMIGQAARLHAIEHFSLGAVANAYTDLWHTVPPHLKTS